MKKTVEKNLDEMRVFYTCRPSISLQRVRVQLQSYKQIDLMKRKILFGECNVGLKVASAILRVVDGVV